METKRESWGSRFGFIVATAGFAIGLGAIWRFPYMVGMNGGGAYVLVYLILSLLIGLPLFIAEVTLGRKCKNSPILGMRNLTRKGSLWVSFGYCSVAGALFIFSYYCVLVAFLLGYFVKTLTGQFVGTDLTAINQIYQAFSSNMPALFGYNLLLMVLLWAILARGLKDGIEKYCKVLMPALVVLLVGLAIRSCTMPGAGEGLRWYLQPDFSAISAKTFLDALPQVFYATSVAMAGAFVYGSYLKEGDSNIPSDSLLVVVANVLISVIAGLVIFPAIFSFGIAPDVGANLIFLTMPQLFAQMLGGRFFGAAFFFLVIIASTTSLIGLVEGISASIGDLFSISRKKSTLLTLVVGFAMSVPVMLSYGPWKNVTIGGKDCFELADFMASNVALPLGGLILALYIVFVWKFDNFLREANIGAKGFRVARWWKPVVLYVIPAVVLFVAVGGIAPLVKGLLPA